MTSAIIKIDSAIINKIINDLTKKKKKKNKWIENTKIISK